MNLPSSLKLAIDKGYVLRQNDHDGKGGGILRYIVTPLGESLGFTVDNFYHFEVPSHDNKKESE